MKCLSNIGHFSTARHPCAVNQGFVSWKTHSALSTAMNVHSILQDKKDQEIPKPCIHGRSSVFWRYTVNKRINCWRMRSSAPMMSRWHRGMMRRWWRFPGCYSVSHSLSFRIFEVLVKWFNSIWILYGFFSQINVLVCRIVWRSWGCFCALNKSVHFFGPKPRKFF